MTRWQQKRRVWMGVFLGIICICAAQAQNSAKAVLLQSDGKTQVTHQKSVTLSCLSPDPSTLTCWGGFTPEQLAQRAGFSQVENVSRQCDKDGRICRLFVEARHPAE